MNGSVPESISLLSSIETIDWGWNSISGSIPSSFQWLSSLTYLDLTYNPYSIPPNFNFPANLQRLIMSKAYSNTLPSSLASISLLHLIELDYSSNTMDLALFKTICSITTLQKLALSFCLGLGQHLHP
uniref:Non-specific serine/threonine protein kinase n=1 Tax=Arcella intermedia TaxID=1963864 RepID=A0A6B2LQM8_9EUKA